MRSPTRPDRLIRGLGWAAIAAATLATVLCACSTTPQFVPDGTTGSGTGGHLAGSSSSASASATATATSASASSTGSTSSGSSSASTTSSTSAASSSTASSSGTSTSSSSSSGCVAKNCVELLATCGTVPDGCGGMLHCGNCQGTDGCGIDKPNQCGNVIQVICATGGVMCPAGYTQDGPGFSSDLCTQGTACTEQDPLAYLCTRPGAIYSATCSTGCPSGSHIAGPWPAVCCTQSQGLGNACIPDP